MSEGDARETGDESNRSISLNIHIDFSSLRAKLGLVVERAIQLVIGFSACAAMRKPTRLSMWLRYAPALNGFRACSIRPLFSKDGQWIGFFAGQKLETIPLQGAGVVSASRLRRAHITRILQRELS